MADLLTRLETEEGSYAIDREICDLVWADIPIPRPAGAPPAYSTSLDAKLPWENIELVIYNKGLKKWLAYNVDKDGVMVGGEAKTEVLARRIAALRARG